MTAHEFFSTDLLKDSIAAFKKAKRFEGQQLEGKALSRVAKQFERLLASRYARNKNLSEGHPLHDYIFACAVLNDSWTKVSRTESFGNSFFGILGLCMWRVTQFKEAHGLPCPGEGTEEEDRAVANKICHAQLKAEGNDLSWLYMIVVLRFNDWITLLILGEATIEEVANWWNEFDETLEASVTISPPMFDTKAVMA